MGLRNGTVGTEAVPKAGKRGRNICTLVAVLQQKTLLTIGSLCYSQHESVLMCRTRIARLICAVGLTVTACTVSTPPQPPAPRTMVDVAAPFGRTWDAVIDVFAERNIPIKTLDRTSGIVVAEPQRVAVDDALSLADCGTAFGMAIRAEAATWNVIVRGDSARSTVRATVRFIKLTPRTYLTAEGSSDCTSRGIWETALEASVKAAVERPTP